MGRLQIISFTFSNLKNFNHHNNCATVFKTKINWEALYLVHIIKIYS